MPIRFLKPTTPAQRFMSKADFSGLSKEKPLKSLVRGKKRCSGRDGKGQVSIRHRGGGHKRRERLVDFSCKEKEGVVGTVQSLQYDPNRSAYIALVTFADGDKRYQLAPEGLKPKDTLVCAVRTKAKIGNRMQLQYIPVGYKIFNLEVQPGKGGQIVRSAGTSATLMGFDGNYAIIQLPSSEVRRVLKECYATLGIVSNPEHNLIRIGKAGRKRWLGRKPEVLGKSMNAVDHPHGGGEGHSPIGLKYPKTPWGKHALGVKTRERHLYSDRLIIRRRFKKH